MEGILFVGNSAKTGSTSHYNEAIGFLKALKRQGIVLDYYDYGEIWNLADVGYLRFGLEGKQYLVKVLEEAGKLEGLIEASDVYGSGKRFTLFEVLLNAMADEEKVASGFCEEFKGYEAVHYSIPEPELEPVA